MTHPQLQHHRHSSCHRHPSKPFTGFCASCLCERLSGIDPDTHQKTPITHPSSELRRSKSYSSTRNPHASSTTTSTTTSEPRRKSCDVRPRNTLSDLFHVHDKRRYSINWKPSVPDLGVELKEEEEENGGEIRVSKEVIAPNVNCFERIVDDFDEDGELKTMKEFIDLESGKKKSAGTNLKDIAGSFWEGASVFRKKLVKWQLKEKNNKKEKKSSGFVGAGHGDLVVDIKKSSIRRLRDDQGEYGFRRRSCDMDHRLSVDDTRYSFDEPRASWDGCLIGKTYPRLNPLVSVVEDAKLPPNGIHDEDDDNDDDDSVENVGLNNNKDESSPGGTAQTRDYYLDRRRRRSLDRLGSNGRLTLGDDDFNSMSNSNAKVSPETVGLFHGAKLLVTEKELGDSSWYTFRDYKLKGGNGNGLAKDADSVAVNKKGFKLKSLQKWRNVWNIWALMHKRNEIKCGNEEESSNSGSGNNVQANGTVSQKLVRSYSVSARDSNKMGMEAKENGTKRNHSATTSYSPNNLDNGLLRFYLTPLETHGRSKSGRSRLQKSHSVATNVL